MFDTFDYRLYEKALLLLWSGQELVLRPAAAGETVRRLPLATPPRFAAALPDGALKTSLASVVEPRALLELAAVHTQAWSYRILNRDEKTVARLNYLAASVPAGDRAATANYITVEPLRGYDGQARRLVAELQDVLPATPADSVFLWALRAAGKLPPAYSPRLDIRLSPNLPAGQATRHILGRLLAMMRANEAGIKADIDIEFLHDYRVAIRRARSAIGHMGQTLPPEQRQAFKSGLRQLGRLTGELRDLDVYLAAEAGYRAILPDAMQADITPLFDYLRSHRAGALAGVIAGLESDAYIQQLTGWEESLRDTEQGPPAAHRPIIKLARRRIARQYHDIVRDGTLILDRSEDHLLHTLRLECKELRYLQEFFAGLFPPQEMAILIRQLKRLQDNLGAFTDLAVQQDYLLSIAESLDIEEARARRALVATGFLVETMAREQRAARAGFAGVFHQFAAPAHRKIVHKLFGAEPGVRL